MNDKFHVDDMPGEREKRVFIGGNYDFAAVLRLVKKFVESLGFQPIMALDFDVPESDIHDCDLRLLHNCKYAIFDVTHCAGELMELERCKDYGTRVMVVYQVREERTIPKQLSTMILTAGFRRRGYPDFEGLKKIVEHFLFEEDDLFDTYLKVFGYKFGAKVMRLKINKNRTCERISKFCDLEVVDPRLSLTRLVGPHYLRLWTGKITNCEFSVDKGEKDIKFEREKISDRYIEGYITFPKDDPLKMGDKPVSYTVKINYEHGFCMTKEEFDKTYPGDEFPYEFTETTVKSPIDKLSLEVNFFEGYKLDPQVTALFGTEREKAIRLPSDSFDKVRLIVNKPRMFYKYRIFWEPMKKGEFDKL